LSAFRFPFFFFRSFSSSRSFRHCERSEAIQSASAIASPENNSKPPLDCFVASLLAMTRFYFGHAATRAQPRRENEIVFLSPLRGER